MEALIRALSEGDQGLLRAVARQSVGRLAGMERGRPVGGTYYLYRTLRRLDIDRVLERLLEAAAESPELTALEERLLREEDEERIEDFREEVRAAIRRRLVADRGREAVAKTLRRPLLEDTDLMHASREELAMLGQVIHPLTRKLAARLAQRPRRGRGGRSAAGGEDAVGSTSDVPCGVRCRRAASRWSRSSGRPAPPNPKSFSCATSAGLWLPSLVSPCSSFMPCPGSFQSCARLCSLMLSTK